MSNARLRSILKGQEVDIRSEEFNGSHGID